MVTLFCGGISSFKIYRLVFVYEVTSISLLGTSINAYNGSLLSFVWHLGVFTNCFDVIVSFLF